MGGGGGQPSTSSSLSSYKHRFEEEEKPTHLEPLCKVLIVELVAPSLVEHIAVKGVLDGDVAAVLLAEETADNGSLLAAEGVAGDVVGDGEDDEGVEDDLELGAALCGDESLVAGH